ncbi:UDP-glycosyltransferase [Gramella sp. AN32]|uniref:UDP-glycosyltransferase n=1 Tax=Christiangramia antarctica TaxID=2058158 RepID=A0ABW5X9A9_9FLAO|nr:UDP-glycosyltransferase [Gramella sp. AN32]
MRSKKLLVIIPDGVSLRNFVYTRFPEKAIKEGWELVFLNFTNFDLSELGFREIKLNPKSSALTDLLKRAKILIELDLFKNKFNNPVYEKYKFSSSRKGFKSRIKNLLVNLLVKKYGSENGLTKLREKMKDTERRTDYYKNCKEILERETPNVILCTNQRPVIAISPMTSAQDLGLTTSCFIFSWDNLPKATKIIDSHYYFVWSEYMKDEMMNYYPYIKSNQIKVTGTPQFEIYKDNTIVIDKNKFFEKYGLDMEKQYLCFSGDDITTSPHDEYFLKDVSEEVEDLNQKGYNLGIIFRRCPVDFSNRYDAILKEHERVIVPIDPAWTNSGTYWNQAMPTKDDLVLQTNIIEHSFMVINVGSSMVFDYVAKGKPCAYLNYLPLIKNLRKDIREVYKYTHFESMPDKNSVFWINKKSDIPSIIKSAMENPGFVVSHAEDWFLKINNFYTEDASNQIVYQLDHIL